MSRAPTSGLTVVTSGGYDEFVLESNHTITYSFSILYNSTRLFSGTSTGINISLNAPLISSELTNVQTLNSTISSNYNTNTRKCQVRIWNMKRIAKCMRDRHKNWPVKKKHLWIYSGQNIFLEQNVSILGGKFSKLDSAVHFFLKYHIWRAHKGCTFFLKYRKVLSTGEMCQYYW